MYFYAHYKMLYFFLKKRSYHLDPTCEEYPSISQQHRMLYSNSPMDCLLTILNNRSSLQKNSFKSKLYVTYQLLSQILPGR